MTLLALQSLLRPLLFPASLLYAGFMRLRRRLWELHVLKSFTPSRPCIAVGNIALGGSGKTPVVDWLLAHAIQQGLSPAVLSRGYGAKPPHLPLNVSLSHSAAEAGDEPLMLLSRHPQARVIVDPKRTRAARFAEGNLHPDLFLLDDGFQHLAAGRHLNLVLLRPEDLGKDWNSVLPAGFWREGKSALHSADAFLIKAEPEGFAALLPDICARLAPFKKPVFGFCLRPEPLRSLSSAPQEACPAPGDPYVLVSGVGNPQQVRATASAFMKGLPKLHSVFPDHHAYSQEDAGRIAASGLPVLCTSKDAVKLRGLGIPSLWELSVATVFCSSLWCGLPFPQWWDAWYKAASAALANKRPPPKPAGYNPACGMAGGIAAFSQVQITKDFSKAAASGTAALT